jgi:hypothetical protein
MLRPLALFCLAVAIPSCISAQAEAQRSIKCYVVMREGASAEGNALYLQKMGVEPEALKSFAPANFSRAGGEFSVSVRGKLSYSAETPVLLERSGSVALYEVAVALRADDPPQAKKRVRVTVKLGDLAKAKELAQPAVRAMDLAAAAAKMRKGTAWIIEMEYAGKGRLEALVGLSE